MLTKHLVPEKEQVLYKVTCSFVLLILSLFYFHNFISNAFSPPFSSFFFFTWKKVPVAVS